MKTYTLIVPRGKSGETLLSFLRDHLKEFPSVKAIKRAIDAKQCKINGKVEYFSTHRVKSGDKIVIALGDAAPKFQHQVLYEDEAILVINKPPGIPSESFTEMILVHRLDKDTSGVMVMAKTPEAEKAMVKLFADRKIKKMYEAICDGTPLHPKWRVDNYLGKKASYQGGALFGKTSKEIGKRAVTEFAVVKKTDTAALISAEPITGRTHQIRIHLKDYGHPILGDWQYGKEFKCKLHPPRQMLHARTLEFPHPITGEDLRIEAPHFPDFLEVKKELFGA